MSLKLPEGPLHGPTPPAFVTHADPAHDGPRRGSRRPLPSTDEPIRLEDLLRILRRQWWVVLAVFGLVVGTSYVYTARQTPVWEASALIRVESGEGAPASAAFGTMGGETWLETEMLVAGTRPVLGVVVDDLSLSFQMVEPAGVSRNQLFSALEFGREVTSASYEIRRTEANRYRLERRGVEDAPVTEFAAGDTVEIPGGRFVMATDSAVLAAGVFSLPQRIRVQTVGFDNAVGGLKGALEISRPDDWASIFRLTYRGTDRWMVRNVVNGAAEAFIEQRRSVQKTEARSTISFLRDQSAQIQLELEAAENALQAFREGQQVVALASEAQQQVQLLAGMQAERMGLVAERDGLTELLREVQGPDGGAPDYTKLVAFPTFLQNPTFQNLVQSLTEAERSRAELRARWTENHPGVLALDEQIALLKGRLGDIGQNYLLSLNTRVATLDATLVRFGSDLQEIPARELQYARLERRTQMLAGIYASLQTTLKEWEVNEAVDDTNVRVVEHAVLPAGPVSPKPAQNLGLGAFAGLTLGLGLALLRHMTDRKLRPGDDIDKMLGISVLSRVPRLPEAAGRSGPRSETLVTLHAGRSLPAEAYRALRTSVFYSDGVADRRKELVVTSPGARDGKSVTSCNLAITFAQQGYRTLLIDGDMRRSTVHMTFEIHKGPGLSQYLQGEIPLDDLACTTSVPNLMVIPAGWTPENPSELLGGSKMEALLQNARAHFDAIVVDSPPVLAVTDATVLASRMAGVMLVVRSDQTHRQAAMDAMDRLRLVGARVVGVVVNDVGDLEGYGYGSAYYGYYGHAEERVRRRWGA